MPRIHDQIGCITRITRIVRMVRRRMVRVMVLNLTWWCRCRARHALPRRAATGSVDAATDVHGHAVGPAPSHSETTHAALVHRHWPFHHPEPRQRRTHPTARAIDAPVQTHEYRRHVILAGGPAGQCPLGAQPSPVARGHHPAILREGRRAGARSVAAPVGREDGRRCRRRGATSTTGREDEFYQGIY